MLTERMSGVERYSAKRSVEENYSISLQLSRVAQLRWRHVAEHITGPVSSSNLATKFG